IPQYINMARSKGVAGYVGEGANRWPAVHVKDAATLFRLAVEKAPAGSRLNAVGDEGVPTREVAEAVGRGLHVPAKSLTAGDYEGMPMSVLMTTDMAASSALTQQLMGWTPTHPGLIADLDAGHYFV
ncbi:MAG TPA: hypothetical protein VGM84_04240, partial [Steroidobacteraceae bacterium]